MEDAVAQTGNQCQRQQHPVRCRQSRQDNAPGHGRKPPQQDPVCAVTINEKSGHEGLPESGGAVEQGSRQAEFRESDPENGMEEGKERRQRQLHHVADIVSGRDRCDDRRIAIAA
ncbi:MAG: hypothetical protein NTY86_14895 [Deltaproteobacteria bacterium]|nr:hypothetical protein [Deltaproteobacteria bacterium]